MGVMWVLFAMSIHALFRVTFGIEKALFEPSWASIFVRFYIFFILFGRKKLENVIFIYI